MKRREFIKTVGATSLLSVPYMNFGKGKNAGTRMIVLGFDGMDPQIVNHLMRKGKLPNMQRLANQGVFTMMRTTIPPQSPVAWSSFITGADPGKYGIFDFVHRDPLTYFPMFSQSATTDSSWNIKVGKYDIPLKSGEVQLKREGKAFWDYLEEIDVDATIFKIPGNYPPSKSKQRTISGMGTPDITGGYGMYSLYTDDDEESSFENEKRLSPSKLFYVYVEEDNTVKAELIGPENSLLRKDLEDDTNALEEDENSRNIKIPFIVYLDNKNKTARIDIDGKEILIAEKEYSKWVEIDFPLIPHVSSITGMVKFYLLNMGEKFRLYVSPIHISPNNPALPISTPESYSKELSDKTGLFHTISLPADTKALSQGTFSMENFLVQSLSVFDESDKIFDYEFNRFLNHKEDFLYFYFSALDQSQHMIWALNDKSHPYYHQKESEQFSFMKEYLYTKHDEILGKVLKQVPKDVKIMLVSDHGFAPFKRKVYINTWLAQEGYLIPEHKDGFSEEGYIYDNAPADWSKTKAYGMGLNGLYINLAGREGHGIVKPEEKRKLLEELKYKLERLKDPKTGETIISEAFISEDNFSSDYINRAPDIILGFKRGYRIGDTSAIGGIKKKVIYDNNDWWSGDHCINPAHVPASFLANFKINKQIPSLKDMAPTILKTFGIDTPTTMSGQSLI